MRSNTWSLSDHTSWTWCMHGAQWVPGSCGWSCDQLWLVMWSVVIGHVISMWSVMWLVMWSVVIGHVISMWSVMWLVMWSVVIGHVISHVIGHVIGHVMSRDWSCDQSCDWSCDWSFVLPVYRVHHFHKSAKWQMFLKVCSRQTVASRSYYIYSIMISLVVW